MAHKRQFNVHINFDDLSKYEGVVSITQHILKIKPGPFQATSKLKRDDIHTFEEDVGPDLVEIDIKQPFQGKLLIKFLSGRAKKEFVNLLEDFLFDMALSLKPPFVPKKHKELLG